jgi:hypothetical protein
LGGDGKHAIVSEAAGDCRSMEQHGGGDRALSSARQWSRMIVDGRGSTEAIVGRRSDRVKSHEDHHPGQYVSRNHGRASYHVESASSL